MARPNPLSHQDIAQQKQIRCAADPESATINKIPTQLPQSSWQPVSALCSTSLPKCILTTWFQDNPDDHVEHHKNPKNWDRYIDPYTGRIWRCNPQNHNEYYFEDDYKHPNHTQAWERYLDPKTKRIWRSNPWAPEEAFYEDDKTWQRYAYHLNNDRLYFWHNATTTQIALETTTIPTAIPQPPECALDAAPTPLCHSC